MNDPLGAFVPGAALRLEGAATGPLRGLTFAAKDIFDVAGHVTGCGNPDWARTHPPAQATAPAIGTLVEAGATLVGKTVTDELAYSLNGRNAHYGTPANSNAPGRLPGGSSSGSAAAVAGGLVDLALGSDTGGSVRIPASYCGLLGMRPSHGRIPLDGVMPLAPSFDTVGWFARDPALLRRTGDALLGGADGAAWAPRRLLLAEDALDRLDPALRPQFDRLVARLEARIGTARRVAVGDPGGGLEAWMERFRRLQGHEIWAVHGRWIEQAKPRFAPEIQERFDWARSVGDGEAAAVRPERAAFAARLDDILGDDGLLCLPTAPGAAPPLDADATTLHEQRGRLLCLTCIAGLARLPEVSLPLLRLSGSPVGLSLVAARAADRALLAFATDFAASVLERGGPDR